MRWPALRSRTMRALIVCGVIGVVLGVYLVRLFQLQVVQFEDWSRRSLQNHRTQHTLEMKRGTISDRNGVELALSVETYTVYVFTREVKSFPELAAHLSTVLPMTQDEILDKLKGRKGYIPIYKNLERHLAMKISELNLPGITLEETYRRVYPQNSLASNLLGFTGGEGHGLEGLELSFDRTLRGYAGLAVEEDVSTSEAGPGRMRIVRPPMGGSNMVLTIDSIIQHILETELAKLMAQWKPIDAMAIAMDPYSGEILGMAVLPNYDLNKFADSAPDSHRNRPVTDIFEPGSCMKIFATACGIINGSITPGTRFYCKGAGEIAGKCRGVAAHVGDSAGGLRRELLDDGLVEPGARGIDHDHVCVGIGELKARIAADGVHVVNTRLLEIAPQVAHGGTVGFHGRDEARATGERQREGARPAVEIHGLVIFRYGKAREHASHELLGTTGVDLEERRCRDVHGLIEDALGPMALSRETLHAGDPACGLGSLAHDAYERACGKGVADDLGNARAREGTRLGPERDLGIARAFGGPDAHALYVQVL